MPDLEQTEDRLRSELRTIDPGGVDVARVVATGHRRAWRRAARRGTVLGVGVAVLVGGGVFAVRLGDDQPDAMTDSPDEIPDSTPTTVDLPDDVPLGDDTTWPGGPFDPIDGMVAAPDARPLSDAEATEVHDAERRLISACMASQGFQWAGVGAGPGNPPRYLSPDQIRAGGFDYDYDWYAAGEAFLGSSGGVAPETAGMTQEELDAYSAALFGTDELDVSIETHDGSSSTSSTGCVGGARAQLYGSVANSLRYSNLVEPFGAISGQLREHDEYAAPLADWQACMAAAGFDVGEHDDGASYIQQAGAAALSNEGRGQTQFTAETIPAIAAADADCQESSGLYEVRAGLLDGIAEEIADELGVDYDHYVAYQRALLARARQVP